MYWGRKQEAAAQLEYKIVLQYPDIKIRECGLFVGTNTPFLGASPDGIIEYTDDGKKMKGVLEIKCPASDKWRSLCPDECCQDSGFYAELNSTTGHLKLKHNHKYYHQVALQGLEWCDFVIWTLGGISVERIYCDADQCEKLKSKLVYYYTKLF